MEDIVIKCEFCYCTPVEVVESKCCARIYCWNCIVGNKNCICGLLINTEDVAVVPELQAIIDENTVDYCTNLGCNYSGKRKQVQEHKPQCEYRAIPCPGDPSCGLFTSGELEAHKSICPYIYTNCELCGSGYLRYRVNNHYCPELLLTCICSEQVRCKDLGTHKERDCPEEIISCPYSKYGCIYLISRGTINDHLNSSHEEHLLLLDSLVNDKDQKIRNLTTQINAPISSDICYLGKKVSHKVVSAIPESRLVKRGVYLIDNCTKETLFKILFIFFIATLLPMKFLFVRMLFTGFVMRKAWTSLFGPAIRATRFPRSRFGEFEQMVYFALFIILAILFSFYSKFL